MKNRIINWGLIFDYAASTIYAIVFVYLVLYIALIIVDGVSP